MGLPDTHLNHSYLKTAKSQSSESIPRVSGLVRNPLKCLTKSWFVTFPPFSNIKSRIASNDIPRDTAILNTTADGREQLTAEIRITPASIAGSVL